MKLMVLSVGNQPHRLQARQDRNENSYEIQFELYHQNGVLVLMLTAKKLVRKYTNRHMLRLCSDAI